MSAELPWSPRRGSVPEVRRTAHPALAGASHIPRRPQPTHSPRQPRWCRPGRQPQRHRWNMATAQAKRMFHGCLPRPRRRPAHSSAMALSQPGIPDEVLVIVDRYCPRAGSNDPRSCLTGFAPWWSAVGGRRGWGQAGARGYAPMRRSRMAAILLGRPQSSTKPLARDWSKVSPVS